MTSPIIWGPAGARNLQNSTIVGTGTGEKNYVAMPNSYSAATVGWGVSAGTPTTITSSVPRANTSPSAVQYVSAALNDYLRYRFAIDAADYGKKLKVAFSMISAVSAEFKLQVWAGTDSSLTGAVQLVLSTDDSTPVSNLPGLTGDYVSSFDASSSTYTHYEVRWVATAASKTLKLSDVVAGPGKIVTGSVVEAWRSYTPTTVGLGTVTLQGFEYRRVGDVMDIRGRITLGTPTASVASVSLPSGLTAALPAAQSYVVGAMASSGTTNKEFFVTVASGDLTNMIFHRQASDNYNSTGAVGTVLGVSSDAIVINASVKINEWSGSGTVNLGQNDVEYSSNNGSATGADDLTSFVYGPDGTSCIAFTTAFTQYFRRVRFQSAIQATDRLYLEFKRTSGGAWMDVASLTYDSGVSAMTYQNGVSYGACFRDSLTGNTDVTVVFSKWMYPSGATYGAAGATWATTYSWRVRKVSGGQAVGFSAATATQAGLLSTYEASSATITWNTGLTATRPVTLTYTRVGKAVICTLNGPASAGTITGTPSNVQSGATDLPASLRPAVTLTLPIFLTLGGTGVTTPGFLEVGTTGQLKVYRDNAGAAYTAAATWTYSAMGITWSVA